MKKFLNNIKEEASHIRMSTAEKASMRAALFGAPSPVPAQQHSPYFFFSYQFRMALAGFALFVVAGTASAAQGTLPGDLLYAMKINVNEKVRVALAPSPAAKAAVHAELADARIEEAQMLAAQGKLDASATEQLAANFDLHAQNAEELADTAETEDPAAAAQVKTKLASSLAVNGAVLRQIGKGSSDAATQEQSDMLGSRVIARAEGPARVAMNAQMFAAVAPKAADAPAPSADAGVSAQMKTMAMSVSEDPTGSSEDAGGQKIAALLQKKSAESLAQAKQLFEKTKAGIDATSTIQIEKEFAAADESMSRGSTALGDGRFSEAQENFTDVLRASTRLSALLFAQQKFDGSILRSLIRIDSGYDAEAQIDRDR